VVRETYALVDRVPDLVGADVESAMEPVSPVFIPGEFLFRESYMLVAKAPTKMVLRKTPLLRMRVLFEMLVFCGPMVVRGPGAHTCRDRRERQTSCR
jgi:hypothetical protein